MEKIRNNKSKETLQYPYTYTSTYSPYGYFAKKETYRFLVVDEPPATIVRLIFNELLAGKTANYMSDFLNSVDVATPQEYKCNETIVYHGGDK